MAYAATGETVIRKLVSLGCERREERDKRSSLCFMYKGAPFYIPKPIDGIGYSDQHLIEIDNTLTAFGLDLWPLDPWLCRTQ